MKFHTHRTYTPRELGSELAAWSHDGDETDGDETDGELIAVCILLSDMVADLKAKVISLEARIEKTETVAESVRRGWGEEDAR